MDEISSDPLTEAYNLSQTDLKARCEREQLNELEGFVMLELLLLMQDDFEQLRHIESIERLKEEEEQSQLAQWEEEQSRLEQWVEEQSVKLDHSQTLPSISQLESENAQLKQLDAVQKMQDETVEEKQPERNNVEVSQLEQRQHEALSVQQVNKN